MCYSRLWKKGCSGEFSISYFILEYSSSSKTLTNCDTNNYDTLQKVYRYL